MNKDMKKSLQSIKTWLKGLVAAAIGGGSNAILASVVAPESFNFGDGFNKMMMMAAGGAFFAVATYLKQSPVPKDL